MLTADVLSFCPDLGPQGCQSRFDLLKTTRGRYSEMLRLVLFLFLGSADPRSALYYVL